MRSFFGHLLVLRMELPCGWSTATSISATAPPKELNPQLTAQFARRAAVLRLTAQRHAEAATAATLSTTTTAAPAFAPAPAPAPTLAPSAAPSLTPAEPAGIAPAAWLRRRGPGGVGDTVDAVAAAAAPQRRPGGGRTLSARGGEATNGGAEAEADMLTNGVPHALHVYAQPALIVYEALVQERAALLDLVQELREVAPHAEVADLGLELDLPRLHPHPSPTPIPSPTNLYPNP